MIAILPTLTSFLGRPKEVSLTYDTQLSFNCPRCREQNYGESDGRYNLDITFPGSSRPPLIHSCWKCGYSGSVYNLVREYGTREDVGAWLDYEKSVKHLLRYNHAALRRKVELQLPEDFTPLRSHSHEPLMQSAWHYATVTRGIPPFILTRFNVGVSAAGKFANRLIIPSYGADGLLNFYTGRWIGDPPSKETPSYLTSWGNKRKDIIFNESRIDWTQPVMVTEGGIELLAYSPNNVPLMGKSFTPVFEAMLRQHKPPLIVALNMDAAESHQRYSSEPVNALRHKAAADREAMLERAAELGVTERYWLELPRNDLGDIMRYDGFHAVAPAIKGGLRRDEKVREAEAVLQW